MSRADRARRRGSRLSFFLFPVLFTCSSATHTRHHSRARLLHIHVDVVVLILMFLVVPFVFLFSFSGRDVRAS
jgi:hypothetical protein